MLRTVAAKVMWVGRATVFLVGLSVIVALVLGVATTAMGANGDFFKVGRANLASAVSTLDKRGAGPALRVLVDSGPPLAVNSTTKVANLNADKVDGHDAPLWAEIQANGVATNSYGVTGTQKSPGAGGYQIDFKKDIGKCAYTATLAQASFGEIHVFNSGTQSVGVTTVNSTATDLVDRPFYLVVNC
jgi:hypothetical protein